MRISIIGAGPAGSYAAFMLAKQGYDVHVFEEHEEIGVPVQCTGIVTAALWNLIPKKQSIIRAELSAVNVHAPDNTTTKVPLREFVLDRAGLDKHITQLAQDAGATIHLGCRFAGFGQNSIKIRHRGTMREYKTELTVGADGPNSEVAKAANIWSPRKVWGGVQATIQGHYSANEFDVFFGKEFGSFFAWAVPENNTISRVGIASQRKARELFGRITQRYPGRLVGWQSGPIPIYDKNIPVQNKERTVFLVGDAAGLVKATTGGGIITGMLSGKLLAKSIAEKTDYALALKPLRKELRLHWLMRRMLNTFTDNDYNRLAALLSNKKLQSVLLRYPRDFPSQFMAKLVVAEPRLLLFATSFIKQLWMPQF